MKTLQQIYDAGLAHIRAQGEPARQGPQCRYRIFKPDGRVLKCIVGGLIPDEAYRPDMDQGSGTLDTLDNATFRAMDINIVDTNAWNLLMQMQQVHDEASYSPHFMRDFEWGMQQLAPEFGLTYKEPTP